MGHYPLNLHVSKTASASVDRLGEDSWHLEIPASKHRRYLLAQLDDHNTGSRSNFPWRPPLIFNLQARVSAQDLPGTWGFGFWNHPFRILLSYEGVLRRLPTLPQAAWFFHASPRNYLSFRDDLPANGFLAATFNAVKVPGVLLALGSPILGLSLIPGASQWVRRLLRRLVMQDAARVQTQHTEWHTYRLEWENDQARFYLDGVECLQTRIVPPSALTLVIWIDNQYASLPPNGRLKYGYLANPQPAWLEIRDVSLRDNASL